MSDAEPARQHNGRTHGGDPGSASSPLLPGIPHPCRLGATPLNLRSETAEGGHEPGPKDIGDFLQLGPLGTAMMLPHRLLPRVLLIDEFDELVRIRRRRPVVTVLTEDPDRGTVVTSGRVRCRAFPVVVITSNGEREFPPAFLRRCLQLRLPAPDADRLAAIPPVRATSRCTPCTASWDRLGRRWKPLHLLRDLLNHPSGPVRDLPATVAPGASRRTSW